MSERHELDIVIDRRGRVTVEVKGAKGPACLEYEKIFEETVGRVKRVRVTPEYYEPGTAARITDEDRTRARRR